MTLAEIEELERLEREATGGEWTSSCGGHVHIGDSEVILAETGIHEDSELIAAMRNALPELLAAAREAAEGDARRIWRKALLDSLGFSEEQP